MKSSYSGRTIGDMISKFNHNSINGGRGSKNEAHLSGRCSRRKTWFTCDGVKVSNGLTKHKYRNATTGEWI